MVVPCCGGTLLWWYPVVVVPSCGGTLLWWYPVVVVTCSGGTLLWWYPLVVVPCSGGTLLWWYPLVVVPCCGGTLLWWYLVVAVAALVCSSITTHFCHHKQIQPITNKLNNIKQVIMLSAIFLHGVIHNHKNCVCYS